MRVCLHTDGMQLPVSFLDKYDHVVRMMYDRDPEYNDALARLRRDIELAEGHGSDISHRLDSITNDFQALARLASVSRLIERHQRMEYNMLSLQKQFKAQAELLHVHSERITILKDTSSLQIDSLKEVIQEGMTLLKETSSRQMNSFHKEMKGEMVSVRQMDAFTKEMKEEMANNRQMASSHKEMKEEMVNVRQMDSFQEEMRDEMASIRTMMVGLLAAQKSESESAPKNNLKQPSSQAEDSIKHSGTYIEAALNHSTVDAKCSLNYPSSQDTGTLERHKELDQKSKQPFVHNKSTLKQSVDHMDNTYKQFHAYEEHKATKVESNDKITMKAPETIGKPSLRSQVDEQIASHITNISQSTETIKNLSTVHEETELLTDFDDLSEFDESFETVSATSQKQEELIDAMHNLQLSPDDWFEAIAHDKGEVIALDDD